MNGVQHWMTRNPMEIDLELAEHPLLQSENIRADDILVTGLYQTFGKTKHIKMCFVSQIIKSKY